MKNIAGLAAAFLLAIGICSMAAGAQRVVMVEEMYQES
jgi:hypothetical protein